RRSRGRRSAASRPSERTERSTREQPEKQVGPNDSANQVREDEVPSTDRVAFLVQQGIEVIHRGVAHERNREQDRQADPTGPPNEPFDILQDFLADRLQVYPAIGVWVEC